MKATSTRTPSGIVTPSIIRIVILQALPSTPISIRTNRPGTDIRTGRTSTTGMDTNGMRARNVVGKSG
jgi:hypothetical protein